MIQVSLKFNNDTFDVIKNKYNNTCHDSDIQDIIKCIIKPIPKSSLTTITNLLSTHISISTINLIINTTNPINPTKIPILSTINPIITTQIPIINSTIPILPKNNSIIINTTIPIIYYNYPNSNH